MSVSYNERAKLFARNVQDQLRSEHRPKAILSVLGNEALKKVEAQGGGYVASVPTVKAGSLNSGNVQDTDLTTPFATTGNSIVVETMKVDEVDSFHDKLATEQLSKETAIASLSAQFARERSQQLEQKREVDFVSNYVRTHINNFVNGLHTTLDEEVLLGATTFSLSESDGVEAGDIAYIGTKTQQGAEKTIAILIKSIAGSLVTIETDKALFPKGGVQGTKEQFKKLEIILPAIEAGAKVVVDVPTEIEAKDLYDLIVDLETKVGEQDVPESNLFIHGSPRVLKLLKKTDSPFVKFENFAKSLSSICNNIVKKGKIKEFEDSTIIQNTNGMQRKVQGTDRYYIQLFKGNYSINTISWIKSVDSDKIGGTAGQGHSISGLQIYGSEVFEQGARAMATLIVTIKQ